jgi:hypothetical protein
MDLVRGQIAGLAEDGRLSIPMDALRAIRWWEPVPLDVIAELCRVGLIRIHLASEVEPLVAALLSDISESHDQPSMEIASVVSDRYRPLKLYADGRLRLTKEVCSLFEIRLGEKVTLFVQPFKSWLEIMTLQFRADRLLTTASLTSIKTSS